MMRKYIFFLMLVLNTICLALPPDGIATLRTQSLMFLPQVSINKSPALKKNPAAILFVSFSMPEPLLLNLADEAAAMHIPVVIKGLKNNDFKQTVATFSRLSQQAQKQQLNFKGVSIDPHWFNQFHITAVPALVVSTDAQTFDVVYGNASIKKGLELIAQRGEAPTARIAKNILEQGHV